MKRFTSPAGERRTRVTIQRLKSSLTLNASGHIDETTASNWEVYGKFWGRVDWSKGSESLTGDQLIGKQMAKVSLASSSETRAIDKDMRCLLNNDTQVYAIAEPPRDLMDARKEVVFSIIGRE